MPPFFLPVPFLRGASRALASSAANRGSRFARSRTVVRWIRAVCAAEAIVSPARTASRTVCSHGRGWRCLFVIPKTPSLAMAKEKAAAPEGRRLQTAEAANHTIAMFRFSNQRA